jgi:hypothetical protein
MALLGPDAGRAAATMPFAGIERKYPEEGVDGVGRGLAEEGDVQQIAIVEERGRFADAGLRHVRRGAFDEQRVGGDAN